MRRYCIPTPPQRQGFSERPWPFVVSGTGERSWQLSRGAYFSFVGFSGWPSASLTDTVR